MPGAILLKKMGPNVHSMVNEFVMDPLQGLKKPFWFVGWIKDKIFGVKTHNSTTNQENSKTATTHIYTAKSHPQHINTKLQALIKNIPKSIMSTLSMMIKLPDVILRRKTSKDKTDPGNHTV